MASDFEEKYLLLRDENTTLKKKKNEQEATIKRMYTKLAMIEEAMKKKKLGDDQDNQEDADDVVGGKASSVNGNAAVPMKRDLDTEKFVQALKIENVQLRKKTQALMEKNRLLEEKMRQHQLKYHSNPRAPSASAMNASLGSNSGGMAKKSLPKVHNIVAMRRGASNSMEAEPLERQVENARRVHRDHLSGDLEMALKNRLVTAEKQLVKLQNENEQLRLHPKRGGTGMTTLVGPRRTSMHHNNNISDGEMSDGQENDDDGKALTSMDAVHLKRELRDRQAQLAILNARYENLEANTAAEREIQEKTIEQLEHMNRQVHKLRSQLQDATLDKEDLEVRIAKAVDLEKDLAMLRDQNRKLEERMTSLCESPFINDAFQRKERIDKLFDLEKLTQQQKATITHMTDEHQKIQVVVKELHSNVKLMKQAKEMVEQDMDKLRQQLVDERNARSYQFTTSVPLQRQPQSPQQRQAVAPLMVSHASIQPDRRDAASSPLKNEQPPSFPSATYSSASAIVTRRYPEPITSTTLAVHADLDGSEANSVKHLKNRVHVLQLAHLKAIQELERCEKMLHAQTNINRELAQEIEEITTKNVSSSVNLQKRLKELELTADERQQRIQLLEAQNRQLKYAREKLLKAQENDQNLLALDTSTSSDENDCDDVASVSESLIMAARDLSPGDQLLEIWIVGANFDRTVVTTNSSTFLLCDFYDFESQSTPLLVGNRPEYNFSSTFKVTVDAFFLRYLASEPLVFELYQAIQGDFRLVGRASVSLATLLRSKGVIKEPELPIKLAYGADHDTVIGSVSVVMRLAAPVSEIWKLHLRSYPQDIQLLRKHRLASSAAAADPVEDFLLNDGYEENQEKAVNELQITVFACRGLRSYGKRKTTTNHGSSLSTTPSSYVHYQILGFPDAFTNIVPSSTSPEFDLHTSKQFFNVEVDACLLQFFSKFQLWFTVFDDHCEVESDSASDGAIGRCGLVLDELVKGECLRGWFQLRDRNDQPAGEISVLIEWKDPFQVAQLYSSSRRVGGVGSAQSSDLHSLDYDQQHAIMRLFAPDMDGRVNYRQFFLYALPPESLELVTSKIKERLEYAIDTEQLMGVEDIFAPVSSDTKSANARETPLQEITANEFQKRIERLGVFLTDDEVDLLVDMFSKQPTGKPAADRATTTTPQKLQVHYLMHHVNPRMSCAERLLVHKIRHTLRVFSRSDASKTAAQKSSPSQPFERFDPAQSGFVSRAEFKRCLSVLGFELLDINRAYKEFIEKESRGSGAAGQAATGVTPGSGAQDNQQATVDLDEETLVNGTSKGQKGNELLASKATPPAASSSSKAVEPMLPPVAAAKPTVKANQVPVDARTEFDRRKDLFLERMKAIASTSAKSLVYEQLEKKKGDRHVHADRANAGQRELLARRVEKQLEQLQVPKALHHDAARILQSQFRQYRMKKATSAPAPAKTHIPEGSIVEIDAQLQRMLQPWTREELDGLESTMIRTIEAELPEARKTSVISRKQLGFVVSKVPKIALDPDLLRRLCDHFAVSSKRGGGGDIAYRPLVQFLCSVATDPKKNDKPLSPLMKTLSRVHMDATQALETFKLVGDVNSTGRMSLTRFREALRRVGLQLPAKELRVLLVLLSDAAGVDVLYLPLIKLFRDSPAAGQMRQTIMRCLRYGISRLHEALLTRVVDGSSNKITREQLHSVLMQENTESVRFEPQDSYVLMEMVKAASVAHRGAVAATDEQGVAATTISMGDLVLTLERHGSSSSCNPSELLSDELLSVYTIQQLQRLARSSRTLLCASYAEMLEHFERYDWKEMGVVSLAEFATVVPSIELSLFTAQQIRQLAKHFGTKTKGAFGINYRQFLDWTTPSATSPEIEAVEAKLRKFASSSTTEKTSAASVLVGWRDAFAGVDKLSAGSLTRAQFASVCLETLRLPLTSDELRTILFCYDRNMDDTVAYGAFVQLHWSKTSQALEQQRKQVQFEQEPRQTLQGILTRLRSALLANKVTTEDVARVVANVTGGQHHQDVEVTQFIVCMKQLGAMLSPGDVELIFNTYSEQDPHHTGRNSAIHLVQFVEKALGITTRRSTALGQDKPSNRRLSEEDEKRLHTAMASALKYSRKEFDTARSLLEEFCVVYEYGEIPARKLWKHMERNGLVGLLSKKGAALLIQKCSVVDRTRSRHEEAKSDDENDDEYAKAEPVTFVSLRKVTTYLQEQQALDVGRHPSKDTEPRGSASSSIQEALDIVLILLASCERNGVDLRGACEQADPQYSGRIPALDFKRILLDAGFAKVAAATGSHDTPEALIGMLVREFRPPEAQGRVHYTAFFERLLPPVTSSQSQRTHHAWFTTFSEDFRAKIRLRAGLQGAIALDTNHPEEIPRLCHALDGAFAHFDRNQNGFVTQQELAAGLSVLQYDVTADQLAYFMAMVGVFRHTGATQNTGLSRMEFDSFVLDPLAPRLLQSLTDALYKPSHQEPTVPRVAVLSRLFTSQAPSTNNSGVLPLAVAYAAIQDATKQPLHPRDQRRLQLLFDVNRDGMFAYMLFMKAMSQRRVASTPNSPTRSHATTTTTTTTAPAPPASPVRRSSSRTAPTQPQQPQQPQQPPAFRCTCDDVVRALYNQLSSVDFDSQIEILQDDCQRRENERTKRIKNQDFEKIVDRIGLKLTKDALACLRASYAQGQGGESETEMDYHALLKAIQRIHDDQQDYD